MSIIKTQSISTHSDIYIYIHYVYVCIIHVCEYICAHAQRSTDCTLAHSVSSQFFILCAIFLFFFVISSPNLSCNWCKQKGVAAAGIGSTYGRFRYLSALPSFQQCVQFVPRGSIQRGTLLYKGFYFFFPLVSIQILVCCIYKGVYAIGIPGCTCILRCCILSSHTSAIFIEGLSVLFL